MELLKDFYTVKELAELLNILPKSVRRLITEGKLEATKLNGSYIISKAAAEQLIEKRGGNV